MSDETEKFAKALGQAVLAEWGSLPQEAQERLFERAAGTDEQFREALAVFLHHHHPRTASEYRVPPRREPKQGQ
jgi:hypothetical protein